jgi:hypothetical protein
MEFFSRAEHSEVVGHPVYGFVFEAELESYMVVGYYRRVGEFPVLEELDEIVGSLEISIVAYTRIKVSVGRGDVDVAHSAPRR